MDRTHITQAHNGYWIIKLFILLCNLNIIISESCNSNETIRNLPGDWPCAWNRGIIPFVFNFYSIAGIQRLISLVKKGHIYLERRSCLRFVEYDPTVAVKKANFTYLYYNYSGVLESCCWPYYHSPTGRRMVLITPVCSLPAEVGHATLHGLGLEHGRHDAFSEINTRAVLFPYKCYQMHNKLQNFEGMHSRT